MTDVALIDHASRIERAWGCLVGDQHYRADVLALPLGNELPPDWFVFELAPLPSFPDRLPGGAPGPVVRQPTLEDWFMVGATPYVAQRACELISVKLTPISEAEFVALDATHAPAFVEGGPVPGPTSAELTPADFAGPPRPNRAQRRAQRRR